MEGTDDDAGLLPLSPLELVSGEGGLLFSAGEGGLMLLLSGGPFMVLSDKGGVTLTVTSPFSSSPCSVVLISKESVAKRKKTKPNTTPRSRHQFDIDLLSPLAEGEEGALVSIFLFLWSLTAEESSTKTMARDEGEVVVQGLRRSSLSSL